jgi:hypothetical protein
MKIWWLCLAMALVCGGCKKSATAPKGSASEEESTKLADDGSPVTLTVKWPVGNRYTERMEMNGDTETTMPQMPKPMLQKVQLSQEYSITVLTERTNGGRELELEFESTEIDVTMNGKPVLNLDTKAEAGGGEVSNPVAAGFRQVIGARIKCLLDASNHVEKVEGFKEFVAKASAGGNPQSRAMMQNMFSEDYFQQMVDFARGLPRQPVKPGDSWPWQTDLTVPVLGVMKMDLNYTFTGWEQREKRKCAAIDFTGTMASKAGASAVPMGMTMKVESGKISGKTWFDPELGTPVETSFNQDLVIHMTVPAPRAQRTNAASQPAASQNLTNHTKQKIVIKLVDVVSAAK